MIAIVIEQILNGLLVGAYSIVLALGLSLIFSLGGVVNLAHGAFYALGAYFAFEVQKRLGFGGAVLLAPVGVALVGVVIETLFLRRLYREDPMERPYVLKPVNEGSSVGVAIVTADGNYGNPISRDATGPWQQFDSLLAEPYIRGRELTAAVLGDRALLVTELVPKSGFYDFDAKYTDGMTEHVCPAQIPPEVEKLCLDYALKAHRILGCRGTSRSDFRWDDEQGAEGLFLLETNTQPGMTPLSLVPEQAKHCGIDYAELVEIVIEDALVHFGKLARAG